MRTDRYTFPRIMKVLGNKQHKEQAPDVVELLMHYTPGGIGMTVLRLELYGRLKHTRCKCAVLPTM